jgi:sulfide dehydrogenase [flavocytochrome c] flavoprotein subunit
MAGLYGCAGGGKASGHVVVVGGGYGGATVAKYLRMWSEGGVQVTLIERNPTFISCPISNLVIGGLKDDGRHHRQLRRPEEQMGRPRRSRTTSSRSMRRRRRFPQGRRQRLSYDRLVLSPGVDFMWDEIPA